MILLIAVVMGLVEGLTEFIPVSSTGHLILAGKILGLEGQKAKAFEIFIQLGAVLAVVWEFRASLRRTAAGLLSRPNERRFAAGLIVAFIPAGIAGLLLHSWVEERLYTPMSVAGALVAGGVVILLVEARLRHRQRFAHEDGRELPLSVAAVIGLAQVLSLWPGISRSGATIVGGLLVGLSRPAATEFSFYLAIPTLGAASVYSLAKVAETLSRDDLLWYGVGLLSSFVCSAIVIRVFLAWVKSRDLRPFAWYRILFGLVLLIVLGRFL